jgi:hypothetical protein
MPGMGYDLTIAVVGGVLTIPVTLLVKQNLHMMRSWFDGELRRQARQISGKWRGSEEFSGSNTKDTFSMKINCRGGQVTGTARCLTGPDVDQTFSSQGRFKDQLLTFVWVKEGPIALESGTVSAKLVRDGELEGHGLYIEPSDGKVYTSIFRAKIAS